METKNNRRLLEIFAGTANLTAAIRRRSMPTYEPEDIILGEFDLTNPQVFQKVAKSIKPGHIRWLHLAPPCATFSRARRDGLRERGPKGVWARRQKREKLQEADMLAKITFQLAMMQLRAGGFVSIESPRNPDYGNCLPLCIF